MKKIQEEVQDTPDSGSGGSASVLDIFETLSAPKEGDKIDDKEDKTDDKEEKDDKEDDLLPLKDEEEEDKEELEDEDDKEEDKDGEADEEDELELKEENEDELELSKIPTRKQILAKYPNIFKEFKALDHIFYREKAFAEIFPTVKDAKAAREDISEYVKIQEELLDGNVVGVLNRVKRTNPKAYDKIAGNIIDSLISVDKDSYIEPARAVIKSTLNNVYSIANQALKKDPTNKKAEQMQIAVELLHESLFHTSEVTPYTKEVKEEDKQNPEVEKLKRERQEIDNRYFNEAHTKVSSRFGDAVTRTLEKNIDKNNSLTPYVKDNLIKDIKNELDKQLISDKRFTAVVRKLYERAKESNYSEASIDNIIVALKNKAGSMLQDIMRAKKGEALKGTSRIKTRPKELSRERSSERATTRNTRTDDEKSLSRNERKKESEEPQPYESPLDYLNRKLGS